MDPTEQERLTTVAAFLRSQGSVAIATKHESGVRKHLTAAENEITHYQIYSGHGTEYEAGLLKMDDIDET